MGTIELPIYPAQAQFLSSNATFRAFIGGRGTGKTYIGAYDLLKRALPGRLYMAGSPDYTTLEDTTLRTFYALAKRLGYIKRLLWSKPPRAILGNGAEIIFRSAHDPEQFRGPNLSGIWIDEGSLIPKEAKDIAIACLREDPDATGNMGWMSVTATPKGKQHWTYELFAPDEQTGQFRPNTEMVHARTLDNPFLPPEFYDTIREQYTSALAAQELEGLFTDLEGAIFQRRWFEILDKPPANTYMDLVRFWDLAATEAKEAEDPDWTVGAKVGRARPGGLNVGVNYVIDVKRGRLSPLKMEELVKRTAIEDGKSVPICIEEEGGAAGKIVLSNFIRNILPGWRVIPVRAIGDKVTRAQAVAAQAERGYVKVYRAAWTKAFLDELEVFPLGTHDDCVDCLAGGFNWLTSKGGKVRPGMASAGPRMPVMG